CCPAETLAAASPKARLRPSHFPVDSRNENLPEKRTHQNYASRPGRDAAASLVARTPAPPRKTCGSLHPDRDQTMPLRPGRRTSPPPPGGIPFHRSEVVGNERGVGSIVSGLLFTMSGATPTCKRQRALTLVLPVLFHRK